MSDADFDQIRALNRLAPEKVPETREEIIQYLSKHTRYSTGNSWNGESSYAHNVKVNRLRFPDKEAENTAYDTVCGGEFEDEDDSPWQLHDDMIADFNAMHDWRWQIGRNGRSGGYLVLYQGGRKLTGYRSICRRCGQRRYDRVATDETVDPKTPEALAIRRLRETECLWTVETYLKEPLMQELPEGRLRVLHTEVSRDLKDNGRYHYGDCHGCGPKGSLHNTPNHTAAFTTIVSTDQGEDFEEWDLDSLKERRDLVLEFDHAVEGMIAEFVSWCASVQVEQVTVTKHVREPALRVKPRN